MIMKPAAACIIPTICNNLPDPNSHVTQYNCSGSNRIQPAKPVIKPSGLPDAVQKNIEHPAAGLKEKSSRATSTADEAYCRKLARNCCF